MVTPGTEPRLLLSHRRTLLRGHLSAVAHSINVAGMDLGYGGDIYVHLHPNYATIQTGDIGYTP
jgi:hypothetical protein